MLKDAMRLPLVTCITCTYNRERFLREALESIFSQTYKNIEVLVVDDASTNPGMFDILESYKGRLRIIRRTKNSGTCELPRYQGVREAQGKYCAFLDSDDLWMPDKIEHQVAFMEAYPDVPLCHTGTRVIDEDGRMLYVRHEGVIPPTGSCGRELLRHCFITVSSVMVRPRFWLEAMPEKRIRQLGMEWDFLVQLACQYPFGYLPEPLSAYRTSGDGITKVRWKWCPRDILAMDRIYSSGAWSALVSRPEMLSIMSDAYIENAEYWRHRRMYGRSIYFVVRGLRHQPWRAAYIVMLFKVLASWLRQAIFLKR